MERKSVEYLLLPLVVELVFCAGGVDILLLLGFVYVVVFVDCDDDDDDEEEEDDDDDSIVRCVGRECLVFVNCDVCEDKLRLLCLWSKERDTDMGFVFIYWEIRGVFGRLIALFYSTPSTTDPTSIASFSSPVLIINNQLKPIYLFYLKLILYRISKLEILTSVNFH